MREFVLGSVGKLRRWPESEQFFRLPKTAKQAMLVLSSMQPDAVRWKKGRSKPDRVFRQSLPSANRRTACILGANSYTLRQVQNEDLSVSDLAGLCPFNNGVDCLIEEIFINSHLKS